MSNATFPFEQVTVMLLVALAALALGYFCLKRHGFVITKKVRTYP